MDGDLTANTLLQPLDNTHHTQSCAIVHKFTQSMLRNREIGLGMEEKGAEAVGPRKMRMFLPKLRGKRKW
jgi:hypothetical protein